MNAYPTLSAPAKDVRLRVMSFGAGVQSTTMHIMAEEGLIEFPPDLAIFADTGDEPDEVYAHLRLMQARASRVPIEIVSAGSIREQMLDWGSGKRRNANGRPPLFVKQRDGRVGQTRRQCTQDWKIFPIERRLRELLGIKKGSPGPRQPVVEQLIGISVDEVFRLKPARRRWIHNRHPLIEADMHRRACIDFCKARGVKPPKSACRMCTFRDAASWARMKRTAPADFAAACEVDDALRSRQTFLKGEPFLHRSCQPLRDVDFSGAVPDPIAWLGECEGMCGV